MRAGLVIIAVLVLLLTGTAEYASRLYTANAALEAQRDALNDELAKVNTQLDRARKGAQRAAREAQEARQELNDALKANPTWSAEPVPAAVADSLCKRIRCAKPGAVPAPAG